MKKTNPIPEGYHSVTPVISVKGALELIEFMEKAFDAASTSMKAPDGTLMHAEITINGSKIMLGEACDALGPMPASLFLYSENCDALFQRALDHGAVSIMEPTDMFWGDRFSSVKDRWGNQWSFATHLEELSEEEIEKRAHEAFARRAANARQG